MFDSFQSQLGKLLGGKREDDPLSTITADQLKVVLKSIEGKYNALKNENKLQKSEIEELKANSAALQAASLSAPVLSNEEAEAFRHEVAVREEALEGLRSEKLQLQSRLSVQDALVSSLREELGALKAQAETAIAPETLAAARAEILKLEADNQTLKDEAEQAALGAATREEVESLEARLESTQQDLNKLKAERDVLMSRLEPLADEAQTLRDKCESVKAERDHLQEELEALKSSGSPLKGLLQQANGMLSQRQAEIEALKGQLQEALEKTEQADGQAEVIAQLEARHGQIQLRSAQLEEENAALKARVMAMAAEVDSGLTTREKAEYEQQVKRAHEELKEASMQIGTLREVKAKAHLDLEEAASELLESRRQLDELRSDRNFYRERWESLKEAQTDLEDLRVQLRDASAQRERLKEIQAPSGPEPDVTTIKESSSVARRRKMLSRLIGES